MSRKIGAGVPASRAIHGIVRRTRREKNPLISGLLKCELRAATVILMPTLQKLIADKFLAKLEKSFNETVTRLTGIDYVETVTMKEKEYSNASNP